MWRVREVSTRTTLKVSTQPLLSVSRVLMAGQLLATGPRHNSTAHKVSKGLVLWYRNFCCLFDTGLCSMMLGGLIFAVKRRHNNICISDNIL